MQNSNMISISPEVLQQIVTNAVVAATTSQTANSQNVQAEKPRRPIISSGTTLEKWSYFLTKWKRYKSMTGIHGEQMRSQLIECCDDELQIDLHRSVGALLIGKSEDEILAEIKKFAVEEENTLISRNILRGMVQNQDEDIKHFTARIKGQANACNYTVKCTNPACETVISYADEEIKDQICKGLADHEIQQEVLSQRNQSISLENLISFVAAKEIGKKSHNALSNHTFHSSKISPYQKSKRDYNHNSPSQKSSYMKMAENNDDKCNWCGRTGHGSRANFETRKSKCLAFGKQCNKCNKNGHFSSVCKNPSTHTSKTAAIMDESDNKSTEEDVLFLSPIQTSVNTCENFEICPIVVPHMEHKKSTGWTITKPKNDLIVKMEFSTCKEAYLENDMKFVPSQIAKLDAIADTGARTTVGGLKLVHALGLRTSDLFPVKQKLCGADNSMINVLGGLFLALSIRNGRSIVECRVLCYIQKENSDKIYLSRTVCEDMGIVKPINTDADKQIYCSGINSCNTENCSCPPRTKPPPIPKDLPYPATNENRSKLERWLVDYYSSSTFNVCEHQPLPMMTGPPLHLIVDSAAKPHAVHTPIPVPVHWQKAVKDSLDRDVRLGVIEPVPWGTPTTWCSRMVTVGKKDGTPRRTVDLQPLNAASSRQTHHTVSPFNQASLVPAGTKKTVCDAWNGYHSVPIREEDRNLTTFITPWGRYRYRTAPQGYLAAGDAYTRRFDEIIHDIPNKTKCVDDTILWGDDLRDIFLKTCYFLERCGNNGITLNPNKFQFGKDTVDFAGFVITNEHVKPSEKYLKAIEEFPTPTDITGVRSWFGLINQVSYAYSLNNELAPFRELLKPKNKFYWDANLQSIFDRSKSNIINSVKDGVKIFDPKRKTGLVTDWSKTGTGFILFQKHCNCSSENITCCKMGWKIVFAGSKFNNKSESRYAPVEGECLAVVQALFKCRHFILGCKDLIVATDHKPLVKVLGDRSLEDIFNPRLLNLKEKTLRYKFKIIHLAGRINTAADAISRYPSQESIRTADVATSQEVDSSDIDDYTMGIAICSLSAVDNLKSITWERVEEATMSDPDMLQLLNIIQDGFPDDSKSMPKNIGVYYKHKQYLSTIGGVILFKNRVVIPHQIQPVILENLHSAHQGVTSMTARAECSVFWPGISSDIKKMRDKCDFCNKMAPSQPNAPPHHLSYPQYPFELVCADYFSYKGENYLVIIDRYSNWPTVMKTSESTANMLVAALKNFSVTFGIPAELASDGGPQFTAHETKQFLDDWGIRHRLSSMGYPHSNCRAELAVKTIKRLITNNVGRNGTLDNDLFRRAMLQYKNTPDPDTKLSPAQIVFGRTLRDFTPTSPDMYNMAKVWRLTAEHRELALAKRHAQQRERLLEHTRTLPPLKVGESVYIQNQVGNYPRRWEKSGIVIEVKQHDQYLVKVDGSGRVTARNRKFLRKFTPFSPSNNLNCNPSAVYDGNDQSIHDVKFEMIKKSTEMNKTSPQVHPLSSKEDCAITDNDPEDNGSPHKEDVISTMATESGTPEHIEPTNVSREEMCPDLPDESDSCEPILRRSTRIRRPPKRYPQ